MERADRVSWKISKSPTNSFLTVLVDFFFLKRPDKNSLQRRHNWQWIQKKLPKSTKNFRDMWNYLILIPPPQEVYAVTLFLYWRHQLIFPFCLFPPNSSHLYYLKNLSCFIISTFLSVRWERNVSLKKKCSHIYNNSLLLWTANNAFTPY